MKKPKLKHITNREQIDSGTKCIVLVDGPDQANLKEGEIVTAYQLSYPGSNTMYVRDSNDKCYTVSRKYMAIATGTEYFLTQEIATLSDRKATLDDEIKKIKDKIKFMKENKIDQLDEEEYKAYKVLDTLGLGDIHKAKEVISILKSK